MATYQLYHPYPSPNTSASVPPIFPANPQQPNLPAIAIGAQLPARRMRQT